MIKININDVDENIIIPASKKEIWTEIFKKQTRLLEKYKKIENMPDDILDLDNINTSRGQILIKDFAWRVTEELAEAYEAEGIDAEHFKEELIDALHFMVELTIIAGMVNYSPQPIVTPGSVEPWSIVYELGLMCNTLKNKPWKQTQMLTDKPEFKKYINNAWNFMYALLKQEIGEDKEIYKYYFKKNKVNQFRQKSKY